MGVGFNATFLLQMIHFYGAYLLFYYILLKPALVIIEREKEATAQLTASIDQNRIQLEEYKHRQRSNWVAARNYFRDNMPLISTGYDRVQVPVIAQELLSVSDVVVQHRVDTLTEALVKTLEKQ